MKRVVLVFAVVGLLAQSTAALTKVDSILDVTGGLQMRMVYVHWKVCNDDYSPVASSDQASSIQIMGFDTREGKERLIDSVPGSVYMLIRMTRDGNYVIWSDSRTSCVWIRDFACKTPMRQLYSGGSWFVSAVQLDSVTGTQWLYATDGADGTNFCKYPLSSTNTVDVSKKVTIANYSAGASVSADGRYIGGVNGIQIYTVANGQLLDRHDSRDAFGCQPNLAPDNSCRFFYLTDNHRMVRMYPPNLGTPSIELIIGGLINGQPVLPATTKDHDCIVPRWTNNPRFFAVAYPLTTGFIYPGSPPTTFGMSAAQTKAADPSNMPRCCIGRFDANFTKVEKYALVSSGDIRSMDWMAEGWIGGPQTSSVHPEGASMTERAATPRIAVHGNRVEAAFPSCQHGTVTLLDSKGRIKARAAGRGTVVCSMGSQPAGTYVVKAVAAGGTRATRVVTAR